MSEIRVGKTLSAKNLSAVKAAMDALEAVIAQAEGDASDAADQKNSLNEALTELRSEIETLPLEESTFEQRFGSFGGREVRTFPTSDVSVSDSGAGPEQFTVQGMAAVFNRTSLDLGGFIEKINPDAFDDVLTRSPDVILSWEHDPRYTLARTTNKTLDLRAAQDGLQFWARVAPVSYAADLRVLMEGGFVDQASFAFTVEDDAWVVADDVVTRTIKKIGNLYDTTICGRGAYPDAYSEVARSWMPTIRSYAEAHTAVLVPVETVNQALRIAQLRAKARKAKYSK